MSRSATIAATAAALAALAILALRRRRRRPTLDEIALRYVGNSVYKGGRKGPNQYKGGDKSSSGQNFTAWYSELCAPLRAVVALEHDRRDEEQDREADGPGVLEGHEETSRSRCV